jgi:hypothetical protein
VCWGVCFTSRPVFQSLDISAFLPLSTWYNIHPPSPFDEVQILFFPLTFQSTFMFSLLNSFYSSPLSSSSCPLPFSPFPPTHTSTHPTPPSHPPPTPHPHPTPSPHTSTTQSQNFPPPQNPNFESPSPTTHSSHLHPPTRLYSHIYIFFSSREE